MCYVCSPNNTTLKFALSSSSCFSGQTLEHAHRNRAANISGYRGFSISPRAIASLNPRTGIALGTRLGRKMKVKIVILVDALLFIYTHEL